jgi:uncharacterized protein
LILYLDTSALVKRYVVEHGSDLVDSAVGAASIVVTSRVAYPEACAAFARRTREGALTRAQHRRVLAQFDGDLEALAWVELDAVLAAHAGRLAERHGLRGFDAIHLGSALMLGGRLSDDHHVSFLAFDDRLVRAAAAEGLLPPG